MRHNPLFLKQTPITVFLCGMLFMTSCAPFGHLTRISPEGHEGPQASQCGACHVEQYQEWQGSAHAGAFTSKSFQEAAGSPTEGECLKCHTPLGAPEKKTEARSFHQEEGVTCISCHLRQGKMVGPHATSALFTPHPVQEDGQLYRSPDQCTTCHEETRAQWQKATAGQQSKNCQECHMPAVQRRATQGTNLFSNILVSFEDKVQTRSHSTTLENMPNFPGAVTITTMALSQGQDAPALTITIHNNLPHDLPTGTFGAKEIQLSLVFLHKGVPVAEKRMVVSDEKSPLAANDSKRLVLPLSPAATRADTLRLNLERHSDSHTGRPPIILSSKIIDSVSEAFH
jgi:hypothetical protein